MNVVHPDETTPMLLPLPCWSPFRILLSTLLRQLPPRKQTPRYRETKDITDQVPQTTHCSHQHKCSRPESYCNQKRYKQQDEQP